MQRTNKIRNSTYFNCITVNQKENLGFDVNVKGTPNPLRPDLMGRVNNITPIHQLSMAWNSPSNMNLPADPRLANKISRDQKVFSSLLPLLPVSLVTVEIDPVLKVLNPYIDTPNVSIYTIHGSYGLWILGFTDVPACSTAPSLVWTSGPPKWVDPGPGPRANPKGHGLSLGFPWKVSNGFCQTVGHNGPSTVVLSKAIWICF